MLYRLLYPLFTLFGLAQENLSLFHQSLRIHAYPVVTFNDREI
jgi:hypothetical protein